MFTITFKRLFYVSDKVIVRNLRSKRIDPPNPGLQKRIRAFREEGLKIEDDDADEFVEQSESDFSRVGEVYNQYQTETAANKLNLRHHIIKEKYFKDNMPNLLTWSEKEQIRHLATTNPDEWTHEKIAESFPVTVPVVKKLLKYAWKPATEERIARHDASAMRNWKELKEGTLDIAEDVRQHFLKFSERSIPPLNQESIKIDLTQQEKIGEFESIIRRCAAKESEQKVEEQEVEAEEMDSKETETEPVKRDYKRITLDQLAEKIKDRLEKGNEINMNDSIMLNSVNSERIQQKVITEDVGKEIELTSQEQETTEVTQFKEKETKLEIDYTQRIRIPKKAYKKGATYKVNDCYYDDDGRFLYRVLGMTN